MSAWHILGRFFGAAIVSLVILTVPPAAQQPVTGTASHTQIVLLGTGNPP